MNGWPTGEGQFHLETHFGDRRFATLSDRPASLDQLLKRAATSHAHGEALVCGESRCSWQELDQRVEALASDLSFRGIAAGDRIILFLGNRPEFVVALFAVARLGAIAVPVGIREQPPGLAYIADHSGAVAIIFDDDLIDRIPALKHRLAAGEMASQQHRKASAEAIFAQHHGVSDEEATALIMYTSGTTGKPKGAIITHLALVHIAAAYAECMTLTSSERSACVVPLSHITGITAIVCPLTWSGGTIVVVPHFNAHEFVELAEREAITHTLLVPTMYNLILARVDLTAVDLSAWRIGAFGGAPMPIATIDGLATKLPNLALMNCYGATETCGAATIMPAKHLMNNSDSVGWPIPGITVRAVDERGQDVQPGDVGELIIGGATVTPGYWDNSEATANSLVQGQWRSGDLGSVDEKGFVRVVDRIKDMINRGGYKIFTAEVESVLMTHPQLLEAAVVAKPCPILGERVHAFVVVHANGDKPSATDLADFCAIRMTDYKQPESFTISHDPLPRNLNGKVLKNELRKNLDQL